MRRLHPFVDSGRPSADPAQDASDHGRVHLSAVSRRWAYRRTRSTASRRSSGRGWRRARRSSATSATSSPEHWEKPLGTADVHVAVAVLSPDAARLEALAERAREAHEQLPGVEVIWRQDCYQLPTGRTSFGFKDGIGQPAVGGKRESADQPAGAADQGRRDRPRLPGRDRRAAADADPRGARPQRHLRRLPQAAHAGRRLPAVPAREGGEPRRGGAARREDGRTLAERRAAGALSGARRSRARRRPRAQQRFPLRRRSARVQVPGRRACTPRQPARRARPGRKRQRPPPPHDPPRHELRADAARRRARGRRRGPRDHLRVRRRAPEAPVRVRQDAVAERRHLHRRPGREGPARRSRRKDRAASRSRSGRSAAACRNCRRSSSPAAASTASPRACARCAGWGSSRRDGRRRRGNDHRHRPLEGARLRPAAIRRGRARPVRARRLRRRRAASP